MSLQPLADSNTPSIQVGTKSAPPSASELTFFAGPSAGSMGPAFSEVAARDGRVLMMDEASGDVLGRDVDRERWWMWK